MLCSCTAELAKGYKIRPEHLRWYAAFHDKSHHPHIHMIIYSTDPTEGFLTEQGITQIKSALAQNIFPEQLRELYAADTQRRDALKTDARKLYQELIAQMASGTIRSERIEKLTGQLAAKLSAHKGKMQYGYLQAPVRAMSDGETIQKIECENLFQYPTEKSVKGMARTCIARIHAMKNSSLTQALATQPSEVAKQICLYAIMKQRRLVWDFMRWFKTPLR